MTLVIDAHVGLEWFIEESWLCKLITRRTQNVAAVALADKNARIIWVLLTQKATFHHDHTTVTAAAAH